jgi:hypothetical protein
MASKATPKRKLRQAQLPNQVKEKESAGRFVTTKGRQKNPKYSFENELESYDDVYADYNHIPGNTNDLYRLSL